MTMRQPAQAAAPEAYGQPAPGSRAVLSGSAGTYTVAPGMEMKVGRDAAKCHITLAEPRISGVHATLKMEAGQLYVRDEQSNNGSYGEGHRPAPTASTVAPAAGVPRFAPLAVNLRLRQE